MPTHPAPAPHGPVANNPNTPAGGAANPPPPTPPAHGGGHAPAAHPPAAHGGNPMDMVLAALAAHAADNAAALVFWGVVGLIVLHPRLRPLAITFFQGVGRMGQRGVVVVERMWGYSLPSFLRKEMLRTGVVMAAVPILAGIGALVLGGNVGIWNIVLLVAVFAALGLLGGLAYWTVRTANGTPPLAAIRQLPNNAQAFLARYGLPTTPVDALKAWLLLPTCGAVALLFWAATLGAFGAKLWVVLLAVVLAWQGVGFAGVITNVVTVLFTGLTNGLVNLADNTLLTLIAIAFPGTTTANARERIGRIFPEFATIERYARYANVPFAVVLAAAIACLGCPGVTSFTICFAVIFVSAGCAFIAYSFGGKLGAAIAGIVAAIFLVGLIWSTGYFQAIFALPGTSGLWYAFVVVVGLVFTAMLLGIGSWFGRKLGHPVAGIVAAALLVAILAPVPLHWAWSAAHPAPPTPMQVHAAERVGQALEHNTERSGEALARAIERRADELVDPPRPTPPTPPARTGRGHHHRRTTASSDRCEGMTPQFRATFGCPQS